MAAGARGLDSSSALAFEPPGPPEGFWVWGLPLCPAVIADGQVWREAVGSRCVDLQTRSWSLVACVSGPWCSPVSLSLGEAGMLTGAEVRAGPSPAGVRLGPGLAVEKGLGPGERSGVFQDLLFLSHQSRERAFSSCSNGNLGIPGGRVRETVAAP